MQTSELIDEHDMVKTLMAQLRAAIDVMNADEVSALRWKINRILLAHLAKEDRLVYPALMSSSDSQVASLAHVMSAEMGDLAGKWRDYLGHWTVGRIREDADAFRAQTITVEQALLARIAREEAELFPLIASALPDRQRAGAGRTTGGHA